MNIYNKKVTKMEISQGVTQQSRHRIFTNAYHHLYVPKVYNSTITLQL